jgi:hypothetical protein
VRDPSGIGYVLGSAATAAPVDQPGAAPPAQSAPSCDDWSAGQLIVAALDADASLLSALGQVAPLPALEPPWRTGALGHLPNRLVNAALLERGAPVGFDKVRSQLTQHRELQQINFESPRTSAASRRASL